MEGYSRCVTCGSNADKEQCYDCRVLRKLPLPGSVPRRFARFIRICPFCEGAYVANRRERGYCSIECSSRHYRLRQAAPVEADIWRLLHDRSYFGPPPLPGSVWPRIQQRALSC